jgi:hypothetical protein
MSEDALEPPPPQVAELANACIAYVERATGMKLDYTVETLPILDHYLRETRVGVVSKEELVDVTAAPVGAYLGEVIRRRVPLAWFAPPGEYRRWRVELERAFLSVNPIGIAVEAIILQPADGWGAHFRMRPDDERRAEAALAILPEVSEDDYYAPSSRVEVLEIIVDAVLAGVSEPRSYGPDDYGPFRAEAIGEALDKGGGTH